MSYFPSLCLVLGLGCLILEMALGLARYVMYILHNGWGMRERISPPPSLGAEYPQTSNLSIDMIGEH